MILINKSIDYIDLKCTICLNHFSKNDIIYIIHHEKETKTIAKKRFHIIHALCYSNTIIICPFDREPISKLHTYEYNTIMPFNIAIYSSDYHELIKNYPKYISYSCVNDLNIRDNNNKTLLYCLSQYKENNNCYKIIKQLLLANANPNIGDKNKFTPLMVTCSNDDYMKMCLFIKYSADVSLKDNKLNTCIDYAIQYESHNCLYKLIQYFKRENNHNDLLSKINTFYKFYTKYNLYANNDMNILIEKIYKKLNINI